jgi:hypothetical protein
VRPGVVAEELRALFLQGERDDALAELVRPDRRARQLLAREQGRELLLVDRVALLLLRLAERHEVEATGLLDQVPDRVRVGDTGQLDHDPVAALGRDERLGDAGRVHPVLHDRPDDFHVPGPGDPVADLLGLVLHAEAALQVEAELGLDRLTGDRARETGGEDEDEGDDADDQDEGGAGSTHSAADDTGLP